MSRFVIDDAMWSKLEQLLPAAKGRHGENDRLFIEAVCWIIRTGAPWRDLPPDHEWHMMDGSVIRAHQHAAGAQGGQEKQALGRSKGGFSSKIHVKVDSFGLPLCFILTPG